jgi:hypothetical protein
LLLTERLFSNIVRCHLVRLGLRLSRSQPLRHVVARECQVGEVERDLEIVYRAWEEPEHVAAP